MASPTARINGFECLSARPPDTTTETPNPTFCAAMRYPISDGASPTARAVAPTIATPTPRKNMERKADPVATGLLVICIRVYG